MHEVVAVVDLYCFRDEVKERVNYIMPNASLLSSKDL